MKKLLIALIILIAAINEVAVGGEVGLPVERFAFPPVTGNHLVCIWDQTAGTWLQAWETYDLSGSYDFQVPAWNKWYWIGLWDETQGTYVYGKWIGHFLTN